MCGLWRSEDSSSWYTPSVWILGMELRVFDKYLYLLSHVVDPEFPLFENTGRTRYQRPNLFWNDIILTKYV